MKLNQPASSSDLETARQIAQRLHQRGRGPDRPATAPIAIAAPGLIPPAGAGASTAQAPKLAAPPARQAEAAGEPRSQRPANRHSAAAPPAFQPPTLQAPALEPPPVPAAKLTPPPVPPIRSTPQPPAAAPGPALERPIDALGDLEEPSPIGDLPDGEDGSIVIEETDGSIEDIVGSAELPSVEDIVGPNEMSAPDDEPAPGVAYEASAEAESPFEESPTASPFDDVPQAASVTEELFDLPPAPSWGEIAETCMTLGRARGAMLIDPAGQVFATRGQWPDPGANAIASKLVAMMEKTLKDAPTRSVSAPLGGLHLTAWRVPLAEGLITAAFIADAPLRAEMRTPIDAQILAGEGV